MTIASLQGPGDLLKIIEITAFPSVAWGKHSKGCGKPCWAPDARAKRGVVPSFAPAHERNIAAVSTCLNFLWGNLKHLETNRLTGVFGVLPQRLWGDAGS